METITKRYYNSSIICTWLIAILTGVNVWLSFKPLSSDLIKLSCANQLTITQNFGVIHFSQFLNITNVGGRTGYITKIQGLIRSKDRTDEITFRKKISGQGFYTGNQGYWPLIQLTLQPKTSWASWVDLFKSPDSFTSDSINIFQSTLVNEAEKYINDANKNFVVHYASAKTRISMDRFINNRIKDFQAGEYEYILQITKDDEIEPFFTKCYSFIVYDPSIIQLRQSINDEEQLNRPFNNTYIRPQLSVALTEIETSEIVNFLKEEIKKF